jgi:hypothetical protein
MIGRKWKAVMQGSRVLCVGIVCAVISAGYGINGTMPVAAILALVAVPAIPIGVLILWGGFRSQSRD